MFYRFNQQDFENVIRDGLVSLIRYHLLKTIPSKKKEILAFEADTILEEGDEMILEANLVLLNSLQKKIVVDLIYGIMSNKITREVKNIKEYSALSKNLFTFDKMKKLEPLQQSFVTLTNEYIFRADDLLKRFWRESFENTFHRLINFHGYQIHRVSFDTLSQEKVLELSQELLAFCTPKKLQENHFDQNVYHLLSEWENNAAFDIWQNLDDYIDKYHGFLLVEDKWDEDFPEVVHFFEAVIDYLGDKKSEKVFDNLRNLFHVSLHGKSLRGEELPVLPVVMWKLIYDFL